MYYGIRGNNGKWNLIQGWNGCHIGQGSLVFPDLEEWQLNQIRDALMEECSRDDPIEKIKEEVEVLNKLLEERETLLDSIPQCPVHGKCIPYAIRWIEQAKNLAKIVDEREDELCISCKKKRIKKRC